MSDAFSAAVMDMLRQYVPDIKGSRVIVALSGGADSVALCHFLLTHAKELDITVEAAHLNHGLRGEESDGEEAFVRRLCEEWGLRLVCGRLMPEGHPSEAWLREKRYDFLWGAAGDGFLATAHTLTDECETLLLHMARGSRLGGLRGIPPRSGMLIRPLIRLQRVQIEDYCAENALHFVNDSSNAQDLYARNRIRHAAMPAMRSVNPASEEAMGALMREMEQIHAYLSMQADDLLTQARIISEGELDAWDATILAKAPDVVLRHALNRLLSPYGDSSAVRIALAVDCIRNGGAVEWCAGVRFSCENGCVFIRSGGEEMQPEILDFCAKAEPGIFACGNGIRLRIESFDGEAAVCLLQQLQNEDEKSEKNTKIHKKDLNNYLDYAKIKRMLLEQDAAENTELQLRFRRPGDRFRPGRGRGDKSLKKWFNEIGCPPQLRGRLPLLAAGNRVLWLAGSGAAEGFSPAEDAHTVWVIDWQVESGEEIQ